MRLLKKYKAARTEDLLNELKEEKQSWESDVISYVKASFDPEHTILHTSLRLSKDIISERN